MSSSKHIVFLTPGFARDETDFLCTPYLQDYFLALQAAQPQWRLSIVAMQYPYQRRTYRWHGIEVHALGGSNRTWMKPIVWSRAQAALRALHAQQPIDLLHAYWIGEAADQALRFGKKHHLPVVATVMGQDTRPDNRYLHRLRLGDAQVVALSAYSAEKYHAASGHAADLVLPFGIASGDVDHTASPDRPIDVLGVGSLVPAKGYDHFLNVLAILRRERPQLRACIMGDGPDAGVLRLQAERLGIQDCIEWLPITPRQEVLAQMSRAKIFLHCSEWEGMGLVLAEALARGCHLVSTPVGVAAPGDKVAVAHTEADLAVAVGRMLDAPMDWTPRVPWPLSATVEGHLALYARCWA